MLLSNIGNSSEIISETSPFVNHERVYDKNGGVRG